MKKIYFKEKQRYDNKVAFVILGFVGLILVGAELKFLLDLPTNYYNVAFLFLGIVAVGSIMWWLTQLKMKVAITDKKIKAKLTSTFVKKCSIKWEEVASCKIVKTPEIAQWSGSNISFGRETKLSLNGRNGLAIQTRNGESYFIGCNNIPALQQALNHIA